MFLDGFGKGLKGLLLTPVSSCGGIFYLGESLGESGEVCIVEGITDGVTAVAKNDADVHIVAPRVKDGIAVTKPAYILITCTSAIQGTRYKIGERRGERDVRL